MFDEEGFDSGEETSLRIPETAQHSKECFVSGGVPHPRNLIYVLVCFGSEGCVLVPRTKRTLVATWSWPTRVVESETCVGSRVHLVGASISFEKNFYRLPFTPPLWFAVSVLQRFLGRFPRLLQWYLLPHQRL
jgi:hypothetical protein